ncbi:uncharacterized protein BO97DRAFT_463960 [Aspergillus homomorphus CBS 101889]|uniref:Uncharacterized protein n=1 Tax=Aspergillus homomorphus (strain CBS 101889) TaxID=1450537 RepID=A0A395HKC1_ASPHC|nr:hypothetical protein BO97DRAFT_463960 [Aspergillus homomorphus CBS 101889]RAL07378.1 hypothetical protein BO97DRAFT_463960 [Aspergillus homomorphus CBS 101889]
MGPSEPEPEPYGLCSLGTIEARIAQILETANVPSILWGDAVFGLFGQELPMTCSEWVIPDEGFNLAVEALVNNVHVELCWRAPTPGTEVAADGHQLQCPWQPPDGMNCRPQPDAHLIALDAYINLYRHSRLLWWVPTRLAMGDKALDNANQFYMSTSDERLPAPETTRHRGGPGRGPMDLAVTGFPVRMLAPDTYAAALVFLAVRDTGHDVEQHWHGEMKKMAAAVAGFPLFRPDYLPPRFIDDYFFHREQSYVTMRSFIYSWQRTPDQMPRLRGFR